MEVIIDMPLKLRNTNNSNSSFKLKNVSNSGRLRAYIAANLTTNGLTLQLDPNNPSSYNGSGATWYDISGNGANITLVGAPVYTSGTPSYFTFNGQYGTGATSNVLPQTAYSKTMWFYLNSYSSNNNIVSSQGGGHFTFMASQNKIYNGHSNWGNYTAYPSNSTISLNTWYYAALTFSTTNGMTLYINGVLDSTYTANKNPHNGNGSTDVASFGGGNLLLGRIGEVFCYNRELSYAEISSNYNSTKAKYGL